ncbi:replication initiation protein RepC [Mangrovicoccus ximenensis]|uniref:replication initiation protein RepC n=1 Tax=Mangrovicoccus ximenensis TaxID=1911570 RepID=UPI000D38EA8D|nr:replication initiation protein RepC [Mangrovicoccus ximenensis]
MTHFPDPAARRDGTGLPAAPVTGAQTALALHKWRDLMDPLKACAAELGLNGTDIHFLDVLLSFVPGERLALDRRGECIVFAANATIAARMGRSGDSTVNRCIRRAEERGLVRRVMSPNRKRYARAGRAYGIDLAPLAETHGQLMGLLAEVEAQAARTEELRRDCADLLAKLKQQPGTCPERIAEFQRRLRRKPTEDALIRLGSDIAACLNTAIPGGSGDRNEQHSKHQISNTLDKPEPRTDPVDETDIARAFPSLTAMLSPSARTPLQRQLDDAALALPGIRRAWQRSSDKMGPGPAAILLGTVLERHERIANPGGYLRNLTDRWMRGELDLDNLVHASLRQKARERQAA